MPRTQTNLNAFERLIQDTFQSYREAGIAIMATLPVPMRPSGARNPQGAPYWLPAGNSPFDVYGWVMHSGVFIGAELKSTHRRTSLAIRPPGKKGSGVYWHQLDALKNLASCGGWARLLWCNDGEIRVMTNEGIVNAWMSASTAIVHIKNDRKPEKGLLSIRWQDFEPGNRAELRDQGGGTVHVLQNWLDPDLSAV